LAVNPEATYGLYEHEGEHYVVAAALAEKVLGERSSHIASFPGTALVGLKYEPLYRPELLGQPVMRFDPEGRLRPVAGSGEDFDRATSGLRRVIAADYVSLDDGTGIVHNATSFGGEDFEEGKSHGLLFVQPVDLRGIMAPGLPGAGKFVKQADADVIRDLESRGLMLKHGTIKHTYPFCWRCGTPLLYYAKPSWYIRTTKQKAALLEGNSRINWYPEHIKNGRFGNWLENNIDWAVSRERYWGSPLPIWACESCGESSCIGSRAELIERALEPAKAEALDDLHRPFIDDILLRCDDCGGTARRIPEVADAWYDSGAMPYAQWHYPFENQDEFLRNFPADFICEAIDQTRGWFYTLHAEATLLAASEAVPDSIAFRNVICLGHINDEKGNKMSKSKGNTVSPWEVLDAHGADATRWYMYTASPAGSSRRFSLGLVEEGLRRFLLTLWNTYSFFVSYANIDNADPRVAPPADAVPELDRWLLSELNALVLKVTEELEAYDPTDAARAIETFVDDLSNWYVRRSRRRFWRGASESDTDKQSAYHTLYTALVTVSKLLAPFTPFIAEELYQNLVCSIDAAAPTSVHLAQWPTADRSQIDDSLNAETQLVKRICSLGRAARAKAQIKVRQPVAEVVVKHSGLGLLDRMYSKDRKALQKHEKTVLEELNSKSWRVPDYHNGSLESMGIAKTRLELNLKKYGKQWGASVRQRQDIVRKVSQEEWSSSVEPSLDEADADTFYGWAEIQETKLFQMRGLVWPIDSIKVIYVPESGWALAESGSTVVAISTTITPELADEGLAREVVRRLQDMRREAGFDLSDRITTWYEGSPEVARVIRAHAAYIQGETLSTELIEGAPPVTAHLAAHDLEGTKATFAVRRNT